MPDFDTYMKYIRHFKQTDSVLECAATEAEITDAQYAKLYEEVIKLVPKGKRGGLGPYAALKDRDEARKAYHAI